MNVINEYLIQVHYSGIILPMLDMPLSIRMISENGKMTIFGCLIFRNIFFCSVLCFVIEGCTIKYIMYTQNSHEKCKKLKKNSS